MLKDMRGGTFDVPPRMFYGKILGKSIAYMTVAISELVMDLCSLRKAATAFLEF